MIRQEQCNKVCRILDDVLANRPTERDSLIVTVRKAFDALEQAETNCSEIPNNCPAADVVPVVRCKDCKHWNPQLKTANGNGLGSCDFHDVALVTSEGFCYWAEKRGEQE